MPQYKETASDLSRKYSGSYILFNNVLTQPRRFFNDDRTGELTMGYLQEGQPGELFSTVEQGSDLFVEIPFSGGLYNLSELSRGGWGSCSIYRATRRQWKRGLNHSTLDISCISNTLRAVFPVPNISTDTILLTFSIVKDIISPSYTSLRELEFDIEHKKYCMTALNKMFGVLLSPTKETLPLLFSANNNFIGTIDFKHKRINLGCEVYLQELRDYLISVQENFSINVVST